MRNLIIVALLIATSILGYREYDRQVVTHTNQELHSRVLDLEINYQKDKAIALYNTAVTKALFNQFDTRISDLILSLSKSDPEGAWKFGTMGVPEELKPVEPREIPDAESDAGSDNK